MIKLNMTLSKKSILVSLLAIGADVLTYFQFLSYYFMKLFGEEFPQWGVNDHFSVRSSKI